MNHQILDSLIQDESIRSLLEKSADAYWLSEIYDYNLGISNNEQEILVRLAVLYTTLSLSEESKNTKNLEYAYKLENIKSLDPLLYSHLTHQKYIRIK